MDLPEQNNKYVQLTNQIVQTRTPYSSQLLEEDIKRLKGIYPFLQISTIGNSVLGKPLYEIKIGNGKKKVHLNGSFHANEWLTSAILMEFINEYVLALSNNRLFQGINPMIFFEQITLSIVPMVNPDGVDLVLCGPPPTHKAWIEIVNKEKYDYTWWKANINGVDLNNQFPANWQIERERKYAKAPAPRDYPGTQALSEPESKALAALTETENFDMILALHSQGKEIYWGYEGYEPPIAKDIVEEMEKVSGYKGIQYIDSHAGFRDWFIQAFQKPGYTIEVGKGINPLPPSSFEENYQDVKKIIIASLKKLIEAC